MKIAREKISLYTPIHSGYTSFFGTVEYARELEVGGVEMMNFCEELKTPDMEMAKRIGSLARSYGLKLPCFSLLADVLGDAERTVPEVKRYAEICSELEIPYLHHTVAPDFRNPHITDEEREERFLRCFDDVMSIAERAKELGVKTLIECQGFVFNGVKNTLRLADMSGGTVGIVADIGNILFFDEKPEDFIRAAGSRVCHAHLKEYERSATPFMGGEFYETRLSSYLCDAEIGTGCADLDEIGKAFREIGYNGFYALELPPFDDTESARRVISLLTE